MYCNASLKPLQTLAFFVAEFWHFSGTGATAQQVGKRSKYVLHLLRKPFTRYYCDTILRYFWRRSAANIIANIRLFFGAVLRHTWPPYEKKIKLFFLTKWHIGAYLLRQIYDQYGTILRPYLNQY